MPSKDGRALERLKDKAVASAQPAADVAAKSKDKTQPAAKVKERAKGKGKAVTTAEDATDDELSTPDATDEDESPIENKWSALLRKRIKDANTKLRLKAAAGVEEDDDDEEEEEQVVSLKKKKKKKAKASQTKSHVKAAAARQRKEAGGGEGEGEQGEAGPKKKKRKTKDDKGRASTATTSEKARATATRTTRSAAKQAAAPGDHDTEMHDVGESSARDVVPDDEDEDEDEDIPDVEEETVPDRPQKAAAAPAPRDFSRPHGSRESAAETSSGLATPASSVARAGKARHGGARRSGANVVRIETPGTMGHPETFLDINSNESKVAAYLRYNDSIQFRTFCLSWPVLKAHERIQSWCAGVPRKTAYKLLMENGSAYINVDPIVKYPLPTDREIKTIDRAHYLACYLCDMVQDIKSMETKSPAENSTVQATAMESFRTAFPELPLPQTPLVFARDAEQPDSAAFLIKPPQLGPHANEIEFERLNRCWNVIRAVRYIIQANSWSSRMSDEALAGSLVVHPSHVPLWLQPKIDRVELNLGKVAAVVASDELPERDFLVEWLRGDQFEGDDDIEDAVVAASNKGVEIPQETQNLLDDPRLLTSLEAFKDSIRRQLMCLEIGMNIETLRLVVADSADAKKRTIEAKNADWDGPKGLKSYFEDMPYVRVQVGFMVLEGSEGNIFQSNEPPLGVNAVFNSADCEDEMNEAGILAVSTAAYGDKDTSAAGGAVGGAQQADKVDTTPLASFIDLTWSTGEAASDLGSPPDPIKLTRGGTNRKVLFAYYDNYDVTDAEDCRRWQRKTLNMITGSGTSAKVRLDKLPRKGLSADESEAVLAATSRGQQLALGAEVQADGGSVQIKDADYYLMHAALSGTPAQAGPMLTPCLELLLCEQQPDGKYHSHLLHDATTSNFFHYQISGAVGVILKLYGTIDPDRLLSVPRTRPFTGRERETVKNAASQLADLRLHGCVLGDGVGLGKTKQLLLITVLHSLLYHEIDTVGGATVLFRPTLLLMPPALINQWLREILHHWSYLNTVVSYEDHSLKEVMANSSLGYSHMRKFPDKSGFPEQLRWLFDPTNKRNANTIVVSSYETHKLRVGVETDIEMPGEHWDPPRFFKNGRPNWRKSPRIVKHWTTAHRGQYSLFLADESQKIRNYYTGNFSVALMHYFPKIVLATATPVFNSLEDVLSILCLLWFNIEADIARLRRTDESLKTFMRDNDRYSVDLFKAVDGLPSTDLRRLLIMEPELIKQVIRRRKHLTIARVFEPMLNQCMIRRSAASSIPDLDGASHELKGLFKKHIRKTATCQYTPFEEVEHQLWHRPAAREYVRQMRPPADYGRRLPSRPAKVNSKQQSNFATGPLRQLAILSFSTKLARLNAIMETTRGNTHVSQINKWRAEKQGGRFVSDICRGTGTGERQPRTAAKLIEYLCNGSPAMRLVFQEVLSVGTLEPIDESLWKGHQKLLIGEQHPVNAWFMYIVLREALIDARVLHAGLSIPARAEMVDLFNDPKSSVRVLIMLYDVSAAGLNLEAACNHVLLTSIGRHYASEEQLAGRTMRVTSRYPTTVVRRHTLNCHDQFRATMQNEKATLQLAAFGSDPKILALIVRLLQQLQPAVDEAHGNSQGKELYLRIQERAKQRQLAREELAKQLKEAKEADKARRKEAKEAEKAQRKKASEAKAKAKASANKAASNSTTKNTTKKPAKSTGKAKKSDTKAGNSKKVKKHGKKTKSSTEVPRKKPAGEEAQSREPSKTTSGEAGTRRSTRKRTKPERFSHLAYDDDVMLGAMHVAARERQARIMTCDECHEDAAPEDQQDCTACYRVFHSSCAEQLLAAAGCPLAQEDGAWKCAACLNGRAQSEGASAESVGESSAEDNQDLSVVDPDSDAENATKDYAPGTDDGSSSSDDGTASAVVTSDDETAAESVSSESAAGNDPDEFRPGRGRIQEQEVEEMEHDADVAAALSAEDYEEFCLEDQPSDEERHLLVLLSLPRGKKWSLQDLEDERFLLVGLQLLYNLIQGKTQLAMAKSIHIKYTRFPADVLDRVNQAKKATPLAKKLAKQEVNG